MAVSTCARSRIYGGRKRSTVSLVQLMRMRRFSISATVSLASSAESSSAASIRPMPRTSTMRLVARGQRAQLLLEVVADFGRMGQQVVVLDGVDDGDGHGAGQRAAAEGGAVHAGVNGARDLFGAQDRSEGKPPARGLASVVMSG